MTPSNVSIHSGEDIAMTAKKPLLGSKPRPKQPSRNKAVDSEIGTSNRHNEHKINGATHEEVLRLRQEIQLLRHENILLKRNLVALLHEDIPVDKRLLKLSVRDPSIVELIADVKNSGD